MKLGLKVLSTGSQEGKILPITLTQFLIGRDAQCQLRPASPAISKRHCAVIVREGKVFVRDFDSTNGTFVNDKPLKGETEVKHGDKLKAGPLEFQVLIAKPKQSTVSDPTPLPESLKQEESEPKKEEAQKEKPQTAHAHGGTTDDSKAEIELSLGDDDASSGMLEEEGVPDGSTVHDLNITLPKEGGEEGEGGEGGEGGDQTAYDKEKDKQASTSNAAKAILDKYMKRPR